MTNRITIIALLMTFLVTEASAQYHQNRRRGVILGGLAGAAIGAAIGDKGNNETAGALIGGAVGAIAGGTIGNQRDQQIEHNLRYHSPYSQGYYGSRSGYVDRSKLPQYYQPYVYEQAPIEHEPGPVVLSPPPAFSTPPTSSTLATTSTSPTETVKVTVQDVLKMTRSGMSDGIIIRQLELHGMNRALSVTEVIELHQAGISEDVITAMQLASPDAASKITPPQSSAQGSTSGRLNAPSLLPPPAPMPINP